MVERASDLFDDVLESVEAGRKAAIEAVRKFVDELVLADPEEREALIDEGCAPDHHAVISVLDFVRWELSMLEG